MCLPAIFRRFVIGDRVTVNGWGLNGMEMLVASYEPDGYYKLAFAHNGSVLHHAHWDENLLIPTTATPEIWARFRDHTATEADLRAIWNDNERELAANPALLRCPDFNSFMRPLIWQIERMDFIDGREPTMADALAVLAEVEGE